MQWEKSEIIGFELVYGIRAAVMRVPDKRLKPGQNLILFEPGKDHHINSYPICKINKESIVFYGDIPGHWGIGTQLYYRGPIGNGFALPSLQENLAFLSLGDCMASLLPVLDVGLANEKNIVYASDCFRLDLPNEVEVMNEKAIMENLSWVEMGYVEMSWHERMLYVPLLRKLKALKRKFQIYIHNQVLCYGQSDCLICSVETNNGIVKTCSQGHVFWLDDLEDF